jgi:signal transduction histidine kinase
MIKLSRYGLLKLFTIFFLSFIFKSSSLEINDSTNVYSEIKRIDKNITFLGNSANLDNDSIINLIRNTLELSLKNNYAKGTNYSYFQLGLYFFNRNVNDSAILYFKKGLENEIYDKDLYADYNWHLANVLRITGEYSEALERSLTLKRFIESGRTNNHNFQIYNLLALSYQTLMEYDLAQKNFELAAKLAIENNNEAYAGTIYSNIGKLLYDQNKNNEALEYFKKGTALEKKYNLLANLANSYTVIANIFLKENQLDSAKNYLFIASDINRKSNNKVGLTYTLLAISKYHYLKEDYSSALNHLELTINYSTKYNIKSVLCDAYELKAKIFEKQGKYKEAYIEFLNFYDLYSNLYNVEEINKATALEQKLIQQEKEKQLFELELEKQKTISTLLLIVVILSVIIGVIAIAFLIHTKRSNKKLKKSTKKAEESDKLKSQFLQTISHEIRTPLNGIIGFSDMILSKDLSDKELKDINELIHKNSYDLTSTIENLVDIAHLTTNQYSIKKTNFDFDSLLNCIFDIVKDNILLKNKPELQLIFDNPGNTKIYSDKIILQKILLHLIKNAISYTNRGSVHLGCKLVDSQIKIFIRDTGIGIPKEKIDVVFSPFRQADETINIKVGGTGLGLSIVSKFIELLNGEIHVESELNKGSTFYITLPIS